MEYEKIKQLIEDMENSNLTSVSIDFPDGTKVNMTKEIKNVEVHSQNDKKAEKIVQVSEENIKEEKNDNKQIDKKGNIVKSPMVGTFYLKPSPTSQQYVEIGKEVKKGQTLCIIEAMKLMNEIESEYSGTINEIYVKDGATIEYGQPLFSII